MAKRVLKEKGIMPPDGPLLVGIIIEGMERLATLPQEKVLAIRNTGFLAMDKKRQDANKKKGSGSEKRAGRPKQFYQDTTIDLNLNL